MDKIDYLEKELSRDGINIEEKLTSKFKIIMDDLLFLVQNGLLYSEDKIFASTYVQKIIDNTTRPTLKTYIMKLIGPMIRILSEKFSPDIKEKILDNIKSLIVKSKEDVKGISPQLQSVFVKILADSSQPNSERCQLKAGENILRLLQYYPRSDVVVNDIFKSFMSKVEKNEALLAIVEIEILSDIVRFYGNTLKPTLIQEQYQKILNFINTKTDIPFDYPVILLSAYTKYYSDPVQCEKIIEETNLKEELPRKLFNFITIFNGNLQYFNLHKKNTMKILKPLPKDQAVILLKSLGKIVNKYKFFIDFDENKIQELIDNYEKIVEIILLETDLFVPSNYIFDANLCVFILSLGYLKIYDNDKQTLMKVFTFLLGLIQQGKVNSQLLVNALSLITLKEIKSSPDTEAMLNALIYLEIDEDDIETVSNFLKKIYYLYK